ncbi:MAG TPA: hypothetical protein DIS78_01370 [Lachnospiraceae bacterium]|nr:hypothetical protein [Lachnospiraceae bacterium]
MLLFLTKNRGIFFVFFLLRERVNRLINYNGFSTKKNQKKLCKKKLTKKFDKKKKTAIIHIVNVIKY